MNEKNVESTRGGTNSKTDNHANIFKNRAGKMIVGKKLISCSETRECSVRSIFALLMNDECVRVCGRDCEGKCA